MENNQVVGKIEFSVNDRRTTALMSIRKYLSSPGLSDIDDKIREIIDTALEGEV